MALDLSGPKLKIARARRHLSDLNTEIDAYLGTFPYQVEYYPDTATGETVFEVRCKSKPPEEISVIVGDIVHNLRAALDQMVCCLVRSVPGGVVDREHSFPIATSKAKFSALADRRLKNVPAKADKIIRRLRPYGGGAEAFYILSELDNMDKHDDIIPVTEGTAQVQMKIGLLGVSFGAPGEQGISHADYLGWGTPGGAKTVQLSEEFQELYREADLTGFDVQRKFDMKITFGNARVADGEPIVDVLQQLIDTVDRAISLIDRYCK